MVSPHLPPEQAANALLPRQLGDELAAHGVVARYVTHPPAESKHVDADVVYVPRRGRGRFDRTAPGALVAGGRMAMGAQDAVRASDLVHLHGNGFIIEVGRFLARRCDKPYVITLYGTDVGITTKRATRFARSCAAPPTGVLQPGPAQLRRTSGLAPAPSRVIYAPVPSTFHALDPSPGCTPPRLRSRRRAVLLTVKRLHDVAG
jgi:hypothetical protein